MFVADSQVLRFEDNILSLENMFENMIANGLDVENTPIVLQYNKRDLNEIVSVEELQKALNPENKYRYFEAIAIQGMGVPETFKAVGTLVLQKVKEKLGI